MMRWWRYGEEDSSGHPGNTNQTLWHHMGPHHKWYTQKPSSWVTDAEDHKHWLINSGPDVPETCPVYKLGRNAIHLIHLRDSYHGYAPSDT